MSEDSLSWSLKASNCGIIYRALWSSQRSMIELATQRNSKSLIQQHLRSQPSMSRQLFNLQNIFRANSRSPNSSIRTLRRKLKGWCHLLPRSFHKATDSRTSQIIVVGTCWHPKFWVQFCVRVQTQLCVLIPKFYAHLRKCVRNDIECTLDRVLSVTCHN